jgi:hypothetical protein
MAERKNGHGEKYQIFFATHLLRHSTGTGVFQNKTPWTPARGGKWKSRVTTDITRAATNITPATTDVSQRATFGCGRGFVGVLR